MFYFFLDKMKCNVIFLWFVLCLASQVSVFGSIVELNDTTLADFPPLFALDDWARCQHPGDEYCIVDAVLSADGNPELMELLTEYSQQTLKHYNRTLVHRGVCVTQCGDNLTLWDAAASCLNRGLAEYGLQATVLSVDWCSKVEERQASSSAKLLAGVTIAIILISCVATIMHMFEGRSPKLCGNKLILAFSLKQNWAIITYNRLSPLSDQRMRDIACIEGLRFLGIQCVIFSHVFITFVYSYVDNPQYVEKIYDSFAWQGVINSPLWLQGLFAFSGFLQMYSMLIITEKRAFTYMGFINSVVGRWVRMTPVAAFGLWFTVSWYPLLGSGPQWSWLVTRESVDCAERWWYHMLYIHNYIPLGKFCMGHTWYLAADMQLHVLGALLLLMLLRWRRVLLATQLVLVLVGVMAAGAVAYLADLTPIVTGQAPEELRTLFKTSKIVPLLYVPFWMNMAGFFGGMVVAYLLYQDQKNGGKLKNNLLFNMAFHASVGVGGAVVLAGVVFLRDAPPGRVAAALYAAADRPAVALCFNLMLLGCFTRCKSAIRDGLEWRGFHILGRLSYCAFINHFIVLRLMMGSNSQLNHASIFSMMTLQITVTALSYAVAIPMCLLLELPPIQLYKCIVEPSKRKEQIYKKQEVYQIDRVNKHIP